MPVERIRDRICDGGARADADIARRRSQGWTISAIEWGREFPAGAAPETTELTDPPYGYRIACDCCHLEPAPDEMEAISQIAAMIVQDRRLPDIAAVLNEARLRTRSGEEWTAVSVFALMPRIVDMSPIIFKGTEWPERRERSKSVRS